MTNFETRLNEELARSPRPHEADEEQHPWLTMLLDAYHILTTGIALAIPDEEAQRGATLACGAGCNACCLKPEVPLSQLEILGIWWYVIEKLPPDEREALNARLLRHHEELACPFLAETHCTIYPLRPLACRFLHVFGTPCKSEEVPVETRPQDMWIPEDAVPPAILAMLPYFGFTTEEARLQALKEGFLVTVSGLMSDFPWENLATAKKQ